MKDVDDLDHRLVRIDDPEVRNGVHPRRDVVPRDDLLRRDAQRHDPQARANEAVDEGDQEHQPGTLLVGEPAEAEDDAPFVLTQDADGRGGERHRQTCDDGDGYEDGGHDDSHSSALRTDSVSPLTLSTTTRSPGSSRRAPSEVLSSSARQ